MQRSQCPLYAAASCFLLFSGIAHATPAVGDYVEFSVVSHTASGQSSTTTEEDQIESYDGSTNQYQISTTITAPGSAPVVTESWVPAGSLIISNGVLSSVDRGCESVGGIRHVLDTAAGSFAACAIPAVSSQTNGTIWYAHVPLGVVRSDLTSASGETVKTLTNYRFGK